MRADPPVTGAGFSADLELRENLEGWIEALSHVSRFFGVPVSPQSVRLHAAWSTLTEREERIRSIARTAGLRLKFVRPETIPSRQCPMILQLRSGRVCVVHAISSDGIAGVIASGDEGMERPVPLKRLMQRAELVALARPASSVPDARVDAYIQPYREHWLRRIILRDLRPYGHVMLASLMANCLGLSSILFSMQVYDRVVPAESYPTLYVLFGGVLIALLFDFLLRRTRAHVIDLLGKRADMRISDRVMGHALRVRNRARPSSTGSFIAQIRDLEQVREMMTSGTVATLADLPFFLLFLGIFWYIAGALVLVPAAALFLMLLPGLLAQRRLRAYAQQAMREGSLRNAMLVESIQGLEDIKSLQAEERFQQRWNHLNAVTGEAQIRLRNLTNSLNAWTHNVQLGVFAVIVFFGAPLVMAGDMTTGALVAASILGSRMMAPMGQVAQLLSRVQHARVAARGLDELMKLPIDHPEEENRVHIPQIAGHFEFRAAVFRYGDENTPPALTVRELKIEPGEKIAVLGRNGAGKSTLLQALSGLMEPASGVVLLDGLTMQHIDPADVRRDIGLLTQNSRLFHGTLRENLLMGAPTASQSEILEVLAMVGAADFLRKLPRGLDHMVQEGGGGLSGGQKQSVLLARLLIRQPSVVLLDEPTAAMDEASERHFIQQFQAWSADRTVVIATHRMRALDLVDRIIVIDNGTVAMDGAKEEVLAALRGLKNVRQVRRRERRLFQAEG